MKIIDISHIAQEAPIYPGSPPIQIDKVSDMQKGAHCNSSMITAGSHMGTHADAFTHFLKDSKIGIDKMELSFYYGPCRVITIPGNTLITREDLEGRITGCTRLIIHGGGSIYLTKSAADYIVEKGIITVVTDACSIAPSGKSTEIHEAVMAPGLAVVEGVALDGVEDGDYILCAFPIKIGGCDGAPVRAVLIAEE